MGLLPFPIVRLVFRGSIQTTQTWSTALSAHPTVVPTGAELQTWCDTVSGTPLQTWLTTASGIRTIWFSSTTKLSRMDAYYIPANSLVATLQASTVVSSSNTGTGTSSMPTQAACVHSLRTSVPGRRGRGRCYFPADGASTSAQNLSSTVVTALANSFRTYIQAVNAAALGAGIAQVSVPSKFSSQGYPVLRVVVDSELDVQRRRANKIIGTAITSATV
jgi:hypothetical protein